MEPQLLSCIKACPHQATKLNKLLPETATICCRFRQQFVAWCGQALRRVAMLVSSPSCIFTDICKSLLATQYPTKSLLSIQHNRVSITSNLVLYQAMDDCSLVSISNNAGYSCTLQLQQTLPVSTDFTRQRPLCNTRVVTSNWTSCRLTIKLPGTNS